MDAQFAVSVTPDGGQVTWNANTNGHTATFTITNTGTCQDTYSFTKAATGPISGVTLNKTTATLAPGANTTVIATYNVGAAGTGVLTMTATGGTGGESDNGTFNVTSIAYGVAVTPDAQPLTVSPNLVQAVRFQIQNTGSTSNTRIFAIDSSL